MAVRTQRLQVSAVALANVLPEPLERPKREAHGQPDAPRHQRQQSEQWQAQGGDAIAQACQTAITGLDDEDGKTSPLLGQAECAMPIDVGKTVGQVGRNGEPACMLVA
jgi:hypothetical protein